MASTRFLSCFSTPLNLLTFSSKFCKQCQCEFQRALYNHGGKWHEINASKSIHRNLHTSNRYDSGDNKVDYQKEKKSTYFITTPIFYVNAAPHIGHLYTATLADAVHRWQRICKVDSYFSTGTDEHGLKIQQAASHDKKEPINFCDEVSSKFKDLFDVAGIEYSDFVRTTEERHKEAVHHFWKLLEDRGYIYKGSYEGWYSVSDECFVPEINVQNHRQPNGDIVKVSTESNQPVSWVKEENYMFRLSELKPQLSDWLNKQVIQPTHFEMIVRNWMTQDLQDLSVSRQRSRLQWGLPVPGDQSQTIYVWLDALVNYLTVTGYPNTSHYWPADCHVIGKDILRFHAIYWPAFLIAAGLNPPKHIFCHSHWTVDNVKMSKSLGNVVDPHASMKRFTADGLRYFLLREGVPQHNGNYSEESVYNCVNSELGNTLGNLLNRCTSASLNHDQVYTPMHADVWNQKADQQDQDLLQRLQILPDTVNQHYAEFNIYRALDVVMLQLRDTNVFLQTHKPWEIKNDMESRPWLECILHVAMETLRVTGILMQPVIPSVSRRLLTKLSISDREQKYDCLDSCHSLRGERSPYAHRKLNEDKSPLFPRIKH